MSAVHVLEGPAAARDLIRRGLDLVERAQRLEAVVDDLPPTALRPLFATESRYEQDLMQWEQDARRFLEKETPDAGRP